MALAYAFDHKVQIPKGPSMRFGTITLDASYVADGWAIAASDMEMVSIDRIVPFPASGFNFEWDQSNLKLKAFFTSAAITPAGTVSQPTLAGTDEPAPLIVEEVVTVSANTGTLASTPFYIISMEVTAGSVTGAFNVIPGAETPITKQASVVLTTGVMTFLGSDAVTSVRVCYIPIMTGTPFIEANRVVDESVTASSSKANLAYRACLVQYIWDDTDSKLEAMEPSGEAPTATNTAVLDINDSSNSSIDTHSDDDGNTLKVTYMKFSALPSAAMFIDDTDITLSSEAWDFSSDGAYDHVIIPGFGTQLVGEAAAGANAVATWLGPSGSAANLAATWNPHTNAVLTNNTAAILTTAISWLIFDMGQIGSATPAGTVSQPTLTGTAVGAKVGEESGNSEATLSGVVVPFIAWGVA